MNGTAARVSCASPGCVFPAVPGRQLCPSCSAEGATPRTVTRLTLVQRGRAGRVRARAALLRNPERGNREIARLTMSSHFTVGAERRKLEAAGLIEPWRNPRAPGSGRDRATAELLADPERSNAVIARAAGTEVHTVQYRRYELEASGRIPVYAAKGGRRQRVPAAPAVPGGSTTTVQAAVTCLAGVS